MMHIPLLKRLFKNNEINFRSINLQTIHSTSKIKIPKKFQFLCALLVDGDEIVFALSPATRILNLSKLNRLTGKNLSQLDDNYSTELEQKLANSASHAINSKVGIQVFIDDALGSQNELFIIDKNEEYAYALDIGQLYKLSNDNLIGISISDEINSTNEKIIAMDLKERVKAMHSLPPMPETASQILLLRKNPDVTAKEIVLVIEKDPVLVAQIVSYANSAFFGQAGTVKSLEDAIFRVLGVDAVMNMALALSIGTSFKIDQSGPIGAKAIWQSSVYAASLMQRLTMLMPWGQRPNPGTAYLVGLLHGIGLFVLGHLFSEEYTALNNYIKKNCEESLLSAELQILGITHTEVGKMVMRMWNMPEELITATKHQYDSHYKGDHEEYIWLLSVVESLLKPHGLAYGDGTDELSTELLEKLNIDEEGIILAADEVLQEGDVIKQLAKQMCA